MQNITVQYYKSQQSVFQFRNSLHELYENKFTQNFESLKRKRTNKTFPIKKYSKAFRKFDSN